MSTPTMDQFLNHERLSDLAQFAVPDGHDLWPRIERAARASVFGATPPRPGILSLGLSRAWTAVGVLFIAATFAALGFGLAVLVLSNGHDQVPAAQLEATVTPAPISPTPSPTPTVQPAGANTPPLYVPDYPRDLDHIRESLGSVFVPTYIPDGYRLVGASVNTDPLLPFDASLVYRNGRRGFGSEAVGEFFIYQFPEGWDADTHEPNYEERMIEGLTVRHPWDVRDTAAFYFQAGGRWHYISVFGESPENADINKLARVAQSVQGFSADDIVDWLVVSGITRRGFGNNVLSDLDDFIEGRTDSINISGYLPNNLGLESIWISQDSDSVTLEFVLPSHLRDGKRLERVTLTTRSNPTLYTEQVDVGGATGYVFWGTTSSDVTLVFQYEGRWFELKGSPARDTSALDELIMMALSLELYGEPDQRDPVPTNAGIPSTIPSREAAHVKMQTILSGDTLDKYRALPPAYQEALGLYTWHDLPPDLVRSAVKDKIDQWGDWVFPLPEFIGEERAERFNELEGEIVNHAHLLVSYYVLVLNTEPPDLSRSVALRQFIDYVAPPDTEMPSPTEPDQDTSGPANAPMVAWPSLETVLTDTALARLGLLGPRLRERVMDMYSISSAGESNVKNTASFLTLYELFLLKAQSGLEMPSLEETLTGNDLATFKNFSEADRDSAESFFQRGLFSLHYLGAASHPPNSTIPKPTPDILAKEAAFAMEWVNPSAKSETEQESSAESWVSENGFIQFTTGDDPLDEPLPGTNPQCMPPTMPPEQPGGPWLVPSKLPDGMEQEVRDQMFPGTLYRAFRRPMDHVSMEQGLCAIRQLNPLTYRAIQIGDRTAYVTARGKLSADGSTRVFDPNAASTLIMDVGYGVVTFNVFGSVTVDELVAMAASLVPEELTEAEQGSYPQAVRGREHPSVRSQCRQHSHHGRWLRSSDLQRLRFGDGRRARGHGGLACAGGTHRSGARILSASCP
ncbi:MAG: hypothetical protein F4X72_13985 [Dehalococcoidia bacterium]|nr:hypothetical protein [Dehalococcoidia bacterium]